MDANSISLGGTRVIDPAGGRQFPVITSADCDVIIGYHPGLETAYAIRPVGKSRYTLRKNPASQIIGIMYEADYRLTSLDQIKPIRDKIIPPAGALGELARPCQRIEHPRRIGPPIDHREGIDRIQ